MIKLTFRPGHTPKEVDERNKKLKEAVEFINKANGRHTATPLLIIANCSFYTTEQFEEPINHQQKLVTTASVAEGCGEDFAMLPQDYHRAITHGHPTVCPDCRVYYHNQFKNKRKRNKAA